MRRPPKLEWMGLMDVVGPFVTPAIVAEAFPSGLEGHDSGLLKGLRSAYKTWEDSDDPVWHREWVNVVLSSVLGYQEKHILQDQAIPESINYVDRTHHTTIRPTFIIHQPEFPDRGRILVMRLPKGESTSKPKAEAKWQASPISQMQMLLQANNERIGLVTNGEEWVLVNNCGTGAVGFATWYAYLWLEEHDTLRSFRSLLSIRRVFGGEPGSRLVDLLAKGAEDQQDVTDRLGYQVRRAVEELVGAFERLDRDSNRELLKGVGETEVYEGVLTVMMRLVFLFCAEERGLLHLGEDLYDRFYAVSTLREQLHDDASKLTEEVLDRRSSAWCRLLATFRMVYQGVAHEDLRIPAYGGTLFDPDRFPWVEGRQADGTNEPPHVSDRIVLHLLDSLQVLRQGQEARKLSFHALDVEQIGHVYEGLLDHTAKRALKPVLGLVGKEGDEPEADLETIEAKVVEGRDKFITYLKDQTGKTERALGNLLDQATDAEKLRKLRVVCGDDHDLFERVKPFANLIREDSFGNVQVYPEGALYATVGSDRRSTGTHYTPRTLTEEVVKYALEPLVYVGPAEGLPEEEWTLKDAKSIVDLKVCDMAMGSGAFLVAACRFLSIKLVEAWAVAEEKAARRLGFTAEGHFFTHRVEEDHHAKTPGTYVTTPYGDIAVADPSQELIPSDAEERLALAKRIVADRCLYGVDRNAMAVEMAKLSLWLTTLRKDRPFTFLDHALRHGDSLLGVTEQQLEMFSMDTSGQSEALLLPWVPEYVDKVRNLRQQISRIPSHDPEAIRRKHRLFDQVRELEKPLKFAADALIACELSEGNAQDKAARRAVIQSTLTEVPSRDRLRSTYKELTGRPTFHWELEFPDVATVVVGPVVERQKVGFDAIVGNPPFYGGSKISGHLGTDYRDFLVQHIAGGRRGNADLCTYFVLRAATLMARDATAGLIATNTIAQGDTRDVGLQHLLASEPRHTIFRAVKSCKWLGDANLEVSKLWFTSLAWVGVRTLSGKSCNFINSMLEEGKQVNGPSKLLASSLLAFKGSELNGMGFVLQPEEAHALICADSANKDVLFPYLNGEDITSSPDGSPSRWSINFFDWPLGRVGQVLESVGDIPSLIDTLEVFENAEVPRETDRWIGAPETKQSAWLCSGIVPRDYPKPVAADYPDCLRIVWSKVPGERASNNEPKLRALWWRYKRPVMVLYERIQSAAMVLVHPLTSKHHCLRRYSQPAVFSHMTVPILVSGWAQYAVLQSDIHWQWVLRYGNKLETRPQYTPSDCLETFPFPVVSDSMSNHGRRFYDELTSLCSATNRGLTAVFNDIHNFQCDADEVKLLRALGQKLDVDVASAYGWDDLDLGHGFHETPQGVRFTISPEARKEVLRRLLKLNHERYAEEVAAGLHDKKGKKAPASPGSTPNRGRKPNNPNTVAEPRATYNATPAANLFDTQLTLGEVED